MTRSGGRATQFRKQNMAKAGQTTKRGRSPSPFGRFKADRGLAVGQDQRRARPASPSAPPFRSSYMTAVIIGEKRSRNQDKVLPRPARPIRQRPRSGAIKTDGWNTRGRPGHCDRLGAVGQYVVKDHQTRTSCLLSRSPLDRCQDLCFTLYFTLDVNGSDIRCEQDYDP